MEDETIKIGDAIDFERDIDNFFSFTFLPLDFFDNWERGSLLSNFASDYFSHNFPTDEERNLISTVLNELIENAVKFSRNNSMPVKVLMKKRTNHLLIQAVNSLPKHRQESFIVLCREIFDRDLDQLYVDRMNSNLDNHSSSGIGLILIKKDYCEYLSFEFFSDKTDVARVAITVELDFN